MSDRVNEVEIKDMPINEVNIHLHEAIKSICKISYENIYCSGFLIKLYNNDKELP